MLSLIEVIVLKKKKIQAEKQPKWGPVGEENAPCGPLCYRSVCAGFFYHYDFLGLIIEQYFHYQYQ